jgi:hypothetical protein
MAKQNQEMLSEIKFIRNVFDTIESKCGITSRNATDIWAEVYEGDKVSGIGFSHEALSIVDSLRSLLYSIELKAKKIKSGECDKEIEHAA